MQARWSMAKQGRSVMRFFVWPTSQFQCAAGMKIIQLHRLFGFETYIISQQCWDRIATRCKAKKLIHECFVWDDDSAVSCNVIEMSTTTFGYRSYWKLKDGEDERDRLIEEMASKKQEVFFDPLDNAEAKAYRDLLKALQTDSDVTHLVALNVDDIRIAIMKHVAKYNN
jgi:hypothetical protein